jgi:hypothetical protein
MLYECTKVFLSLVFAYHRELLSSHNPAECVITYTACSDDGRVHIMKENKFFCKPFYKLNTLIPASVLKV